MALTNYISALEKDLHPWQRVHLWILLQAREDWATARALEYIDERGLVDVSALRWKSRNYLYGSFNTPTTRGDLENLANYWRGRAPAASLAALGIPELSREEFLNGLNRAAEVRRPRLDLYKLDEL